MITVVLFFSVAGIFRYFRKELLKINKFRSYQIVAYEDGSDIIVLKIKSKKIFICLFPFRIAFPITLLDR